MDNIYILKQNSTECIIHVVSPKHVCTAVVQVHYQKTSFLQVYNAHRSLKQTPTGWHDPRCYTLVYVLRSISFPNVILTKTSIRDLTSSQCHPTEPEETVHISMDPFPRPEAITLPSALAARATTGDGLQFTCLYLCSSSIFSEEGTDKGGETEEEGMELAEEGMCIYISVSVSVSVSVCVCVRERV